ncbi:SulP family inorganic anion transporter [Nocardia africana]|uniref:Probable sulfate transporter Rv1739c/MT1781 n=1 Tax=Nocardia africana TaxID=134964 RepID=A0A378WX34_9NOCA|nr:SulP family inorganic anion transporter [Nocardia africana]MCC3313602.1 SulP family inorganic anion transporter [Nocardia africana]SUA45021.1 Probable sulfate transporter Rv1739c/MT1781 [Nocardia africana]
MKRLAPAGLVRSFGRRLGRPAPRDVLAGLVTGLFSIPEGMAYASIGGFNPVTGLYSGMIPTLAGSVLTRTVLMVTTLTSAIALSSQSVLTSAGLDPHEPGNIAMLVILVGVVMAVLGLVRAGSIMSFVSSAVMTGFTTGIAVQIVAGVLGDATGYEPHRHNTIAKIADSLAHIGSWHGTTVAVTAATVAVWAVCRLVKPMASLATLIALVVVTAAVALIGVGVDTVGNIASIPNAFPAPTLPAMASLPELLVGAFAVALVALAQAAGISSAVPNPDGSRPNASGDFVAQGAANIAGGFFGALPTGGSLSRTGVAVSAGAQTRWAGIFAGVWLIGLVLVAGSVAEIIPMAVIGGLVLVIGVELVAGRWGDIRLVMRTAPWSALAMAITFLATTQLPLQNAILIGAALSLLLYCVQASRFAKLVALQPCDDGQWRIVDVPSECPSGEVTVLHYAGVGLFAEIPRIDESWPSASNMRGGVLILSLRSMPDVPSATVIQDLTRHAATVTDNGSLLVIAGIDRKFTRVFDHSGLTDVIGRDNIFEATDQVFGALDAALAHARVWIANHK